MSTKAVFAVTVLLFARDLGAQERRPAQEKQAWEWTIEERIAMRTSTERMHQMGVVPTKSGQIHITGARNPELLLPSELFGRLLWVAFNPNPDGREMIRADFEARARDAGVTLPERFWETLGSAAADYIATFDKKANLAKERQNARVREENELSQKFIGLQKSQCRLRASALAKARTIFGPTVMDRFLYTAVAPTTFVTALAKENAKNLQAEEEGCE